MHWIALPLPQWSRESPAGALLAEADAAGWWALRFTPRVVVLGALVGRPRSLAGTDPCGLGAGSGGR